jgi:hypothetical protein
LLVDGSNETITHGALWLVPHSSPRSPVSQYFDPARLVVARVPFADFDRHVVLAVRVLGMLIEIAGTEEMAAASFHVICFHPPCWFSGSRGQED